MIMAPTSSLSSSTLCQGGQKYKFLLHCIPISGHFLPTQAIARELVSRGHDVVWLISVAYEQRVRALGARFFPTQHVDLLDPGFIGEIENNLPAVIKASYEGRTIAQVADLRRALATFSPDCVINDVLPQGVQALYELGEIPIYATIGAIPMYLPNTPQEVCTTMVPGGQLPSPLKAGDMFSSPWVVLTSINPQREQLGLPALEPSDGFNYSPFLHIQASCAELEFQCETKPRLLSAEYVGPLVETANLSSLHLPSWWEDIVKAPIVIGITQGTFATDPTLLLIPAITTLSPDASLLLVVPSHREDEIRKRTTVPENVRIAKWVPYDLLLPQCDIFITKRRLW